MVGCNGDWRLVEAQDINEDGWIVGWARYWNGESYDRRAFLLVPRARACSGDITGGYLGVPDGYVDVSDLLAVLANWGDCDACDPCQADTDGNGRVDTGDLLAVLGTWNGETRFACDGCGDVPESVQDCIDKIGYGNPEALAACIEFVTGGS